MGIIMPIIIWSEKIRVNVASKLLVTRFWRLIIIRNRFLSRCSTKSKVSFKILCVCERERVSNCV